MMFKCQNLVDKVDFFKDLPPPLRIQIVRKLRPEVYLKNEVIFPIGSIGVSMFFIYVGSVGIYSRTGREVRTRVKLVIAAGRERKRNLVFVRQSLAKHLPLFGQHFDLSSITNFVSSK